MRSASYFVVGDVFATSLSVEIEAGDKRPRSVTRDEMWMLLCQAYDWLLVEDPIASFQVER